MKIKAEKLTTCLCNQQLVGKEELIIDRVKNPDSHHWEGEGSASGQMAVLSLLISNWRQKHFSELIREHLNKNKV